MALKSPILTGNARLDQAAAGPPSVKKGPPHDDPGAVRRIQRALVKLGHPLPKSFPAGPSSEPDGIFGDETQGVVIAFQRKVFPNEPKEWDGRVGQKTLAKMDEGLGAGRDGDERFQGFNGEQIDILKDDLARATRFLSVVTQKMSGSVILPQAVVDDTETKVRNVFKTEDDNSSPITTAFRKTELMLNFRILRAGMDNPFPIQGEPGSALGRAAFVVGIEEPTVHVHQNYFNLHQDDRAVTLIHERAHTLLKAPGHPGTNDVLFCVIPHEGVQFPKITYDQAIKNAYCYELLTLALQSTYDPARFRMSPLCSAP